MTDELLKKVSKDEQLWAYRRSREMYEREQITLRNQAWKDGRKEGMEQGLQEGLVQGLAEGRQKGLKEGHMEGRREEALTIAKRMKVRGLEVNEIAEITELSADDIRNL